MVLPVRGSQSFEECHRGEVCWSSSVRKPADIPAVAGSLNRDLDSGVVQSLVLIPYPTKTKALVLVELGL